MPLARAPRACQGYPVALPDPRSDRAGDGTAPADRVLRVGAALTVIGLLCAVVALLPLVVPDLELPPAMWFLAMLTGVGLIVVFVGLAMGARSRRRRVP